MVSDPRSQRLIRPAVGGMPSASRFPRPLSSATRRTRRSSASISITMAPGGMAVHQKWELPFYKAGGLQFVQGPKRFASPCSSVPDLVGRSPDWQRDALRRLVLNHDLTEADFDALTEICKSCQSPGSNVVTGWRCRQQTSGTDNLGSRLRAPPDPFNKSLNDERGPRRQLRSRREHDSALPRTAKSGTLW